ncbi:MAG: flagellar export chaperone FliS [Chloroflexi bacterium]|nr:flagellar export chaperone FliS [Chloroflexota bacterium]
MLTHPATAYRRASVQTSSPAQLIVLLYRRAVQSTREGARALQLHDREEAHRGLVHAQAIVAELRSALRMDAGPVAETLDGLYDFFQRQLLQANLTKDPVMASEVADMLESLLQAWETALAGPGEGPSVVRLGDTVRSTEHSA